MANSWPTAENLGRTQSSTGKTRRWSVDAVKRTDNKGNATWSKQDRLSRSLSGHLPYLKITPQTGTRYAVQSPRTPSLGRPQPHDTPLRGSVSPTTHPRTSPARMCLSQPNTPSGQDAIDGSSLLVYLSNDHGLTSPWSESALPRTRPESRSFAGEFSALSPRATSRSPSATQTNSHHDDDEDDASRPYTPATVRPGSAALEPIIEVAASDQDVSLGDTSAFVFDRYRFSSNSSRSEPAGTSAPASPTSARRSAASTSRTSRSSSPQDGSAGFRPKQFLLQGVLESSEQSTDKTGHSRKLSRSFSVPLLELESTQPKRRFKASGMDEAQSVIAESPPSPSGTYTTPTAGMSEKLSPSWGCKGPTMSASAAEKGILADSDAGGDPSSTVTTETGSVCELSDPPTSKSIPTEIRVFEPSGCSSFHINDDDGATQHTPPRSRSTDCTSWRQSDSVLPATRRKEQTCGEGEADQTLRADSLSPPRSAASAETRSSENIELVPWQIATTDSASTRRSEEIFRPLSMAQSQNRGAESSRDTLMSGRLRGRVGAMWPLVGRRCRCSRRG